MSGVLTQSRSDYFSHIATVSLQRCCSSFVKVGARTSEPHITTYPAPAKANCFEISLSRKEKGAENKSLTRAFRV